jgi:hypothetical protein
MQHALHYLQMIKLAQSANNMIESYQVLSIEQRVDVNKPHYTKRKEKVINYYLTRYSQTISHSKEVWNLCLALRYAE